MKFIRSNAAIILLVGVLVFLFRNWFTRGYLTAPDFPFIYPLQLGDFLSLPYAWSHILGNGLGGSTVTTLYLDTYVHVGTQLLVFMFNIPWNAAYRILFFWPFLVVGTAGSLYFGFSLFKNKLAASLGSLIYMSNTYVLMLAGGGQVGLMMAYAFVPLVMASFIRRQAFLFTASLVFMLLFDLRFSLLSAVALGVYVVFFINRNEWMGVVKFCTVPLLIAMGLHSFWLVPTFFAGGLSLPEGFGNVDWLSYLSWAEFSKTFSLLHPNWPENIFGKTYFFQPEFILIPFIAFLPLAIRRKKTREMLVSPNFFYVLGLLGAFFAKGANPPFGAINSWIFTTIPLMNVFRDPTKFYLLVVIAYSVLLPCSIVRIAELVKTYRPKKKTYYLVYIVFVLFWLITIRPLLAGTLSGTFGNVHVPDSYTNFAKYVYAEPRFGRTLAVPWRNRFIFQSENHPIIDARDIYQTTEIDEIMAALRAPNADAKLKALGIQYIVVPEDITAEVFVSDRTYDSAKRESVIHILDSLSFVEKIKGFEGLDVYRFTRFTGHFYTVLPNWDVNVFTAHAVDPVTYRVDLGSLPRPVTIKFSEGYDPKWQLWDGGKYISPKQSTDGTIDYELDERITDQVTVFYEGQRFVVLGSRISLVALTLIILGLYIYASRKLKFDTKIHVVVIIFIFGSLVIFAPRSSQKNSISDQNIWWSTGWSKLNNPVLNAPMAISRYGGSELRFNIRGTNILRITASSPNNEAGSQGIDVFVDGNMYSIVTPLYDTQLLLPDGALVPHKSYDIRVRHWCAGTLSPCEAGIQSIDVSTQALISKPAGVPKKVIAFLGDSISVSFGKMNFTYMIADKLGYQLHNASIFGSSVSPVPYWDNAIGRYQSDIVRFHPDVLVIFLGTNDLGQNIPIETFRQNYSQLISGIRKGSPNTRIITLGLMWRMDFSPADILRYSRVIEEVALANGLPYISPYSWLDKKDYQDVVHPSPSSQAKIAEKLYNSIATLIK